MKSLIKRKESNPSKILKYIFRNMPVSRAAIAENTEIAPATVTINIAAMIAQKVVLDIGTPTQAAEGTMGRKRTLIDINRQYAYTIGAEFTAKSLAFCITDLKGTVIDSISTVPTPEQIAQITDSIISYVQMLIQRNNIPVSAYIGLGIAVPGQANGDHISMVNHSDEWKQFDRHKIEVALGLPVVFENNIRAMAYGEYFFHHDDCPESFSLLHIGLGMFCANVLNGEVFSRDHCFSGEIGHTIVNVDGKRCECGKHGCLQTYASENWLIKGAQLLYTNNLQTILHSLVPCANDITIEHVMAAYSMGDSGTILYLTEALKYLAATIFNLIVVISPKKIFLHGQLFTNKDIRQELMGYVQRYLAFSEDGYINDIEFLPYTPLDGCTGACALVIDRCFIAGFGSADLT